MTPQELAEIHLDRDEFLRITTARRDRMFAHIERCRIDLDGMNDLITMLQEHRDKDNLTGSYVAPSATEEPTGEGSPSPDEQQERKAA